MCAQRPERPGIRGTAQFTATTCTSGIIRMQGGSQARTLQQTEGIQRRDVITKVASFRDLKKAWTDGAAHIEVTSHLDATNFPLVEAEMNNEVFQHLLPMQLASTRSVRVRLSPPTLYESRLGVLF